MGAFFGCVIITLILYAGFDMIGTELGRIADALENKNKKAKKAYLRFEQATEKLEILAKDPLLNTKHPGL